MNNHPTFLSSALTTGIPIIMLYVVVTLLNLYRSE